MLLSNVREAINTDAWIRENLTPEEKIMFMRIGGSHPSLTGTGLTRWFWTNCVNPKLHGLEFDYVFSEGTQEKSIFAAKKIGFETKKEILMENLPQEFWNRVVTKVPEHPRLALQVLKL